MFAALLGFAAAARESGRHLRDNKTESAFLTAALHDALTRAEGSGARDVGACGGLGAAQQRNRREPLLGALVVAGDGHSAS